MKPIKFNYVIVLSAWLVCVASQVTAAPLGTAFTYQGRLAGGTNAITGLCNMSFSLFDAETNGTQVGLTLVKWAVPVTNGLFAVSLDFSNVFAGNATWLSTSVMPPGTSDWTMLSPRQPLTPAPYAIFASVLSSNVNQTFAGTVSFSRSSGPPFTVSSASKVVNLNADLLDGLDSGAFWQLGGNAGTTAGVNFLGTTDNRALELKVYGQRALRLEPTAGAPNFIAGASDNSAGYTGASVGGGSSNSAYATYATIGGGLANKIQQGEEGGPYATIGGGERNSATSYYATISGGQSNVCDSAHGYATIGGGVRNHNVGDYGTIGGGKGNFIREDFPLDHTGSTIGGGESNIVNASYGSVGGGLGNLVNSTFGVIAGGVRNIVLSTNASIAGGESNVINGACASIGGGFGNVVSNSFAVIAGGKSNLIFGSYASLGGGSGNGAGCYQYIVIGGGQENSANSHYATIGGGSGNTISVSENGSDWCTIGGGIANRTFGAAATIGGGAGNFCGGWQGYSTVAGGSGNNNSGSYGTIAGGKNNRVVEDYPALHLGPTIGGGETNAVNCSYGTVAGGSGNCVSNDFGVVSGGRLNKVTASYGFIGGGVQNIAAGAGAVVAGGGYDGSTVNSNYAAGASSTISGGTQNIATGSRSAIGGGHNNTVTNYYATVPGGGWNLAGGQGSFAAGRAAKALHDGAFVWSDDNASGDVLSTNANSVTMRARGGYRLFSNGGQSAGVGLAPGATSWSTLCDRNAKKNFASVDVQAVLEKLARVPVQQWNYQWEQDADTPHLGPMAQEFKREFYPGTDDHSITTLEFDGVELAAIQGLNQLVAEKNSRIEALERDVTELKSLVKRLANQSNGGVR